MRHFFIVVMVLFYCMPAIFAAEPKYQASKRERFGQYLAGIEYLEAAHRLSIEDKVAYYKKLVEITGFNAETAQAHMEKYQDDPERWLKVIESVLEIINTPLKNGEE